MQERVSYLKLIFRSLQLLVILLMTCLAGQANESDEVDALFKEYTKGVRPGAAVMVIKNHKVVHQKGYGYADLKARTPLSPSSVFRLGSISKQFTAAAIMLLADQGKLSYDDPVAKYVPMLKGYDGITIRHLLIHTSGLPDYYDDIDLDPGGDFPSNRDVMTFLGEMDDPVFEPGEKFEYSNPGYEVLPEIVEAASGMSFAEFMKKELFSKTKMRNSLIHDHRGPKIKNRVFGYKTDGDGFELCDYDILNGITGSGGQYSPLDDLYHWDQALYGTTLMKRATLDQAFISGKLNNGKEVGYGFGWELDEYRGFQRFSHTGSWVGFHNAYARFPKEKLSVIVLMNFAEAEPKKLLEKVVDIYLLD